MSERTSERRNPTEISAPPGTPFIDVTREFDAPPARVFRAHTEPDLIARWMGPSSMEIEILEFDARPGGSYRYLHRSRDGGQEYGFRGVFHSVDRDHRIVRTFEYVGTPDQVSLETLTLEDLGGRTRVRGHSVFPSVAARDEMLATGMESGLTEAMDRLQEVVDRPETASTGAGRVVVDITMSLDGYVTGPDAGPDLGLGRDGEVLHEWVTSGEDPRDAEVLRRAAERAGAVIMGRRTFDIVDGPQGWGDTRDYAPGALEEEEPPPVFVVTHQAPERVRLANRFTFVTDGPEKALAAARAAAGGKDVVVMGGGELCHAYLAAGLADELVLHVAPVVLGSGTRLFPADPAARVELALVEAVSTAAAQHLTYRVTG